MENNLVNFIQQNSPDSALNRTDQGGDFLQSDQWRKFQESVGRKTYNITQEDFHANILEHSLPIVGKYFYIPRGPVIKEQGTMIKEQFEELIGLAKKNDIGWIRIEPGSSEILEAIRSNTGSKLAKAPHDMQPKALFVIDITKPEEQLLSEMKPKARYNIKVAQKHGVTVTSGQGTINNKNIEEFLRLTEIMAKRQGIQAHPDSYYRKMLEIIPENILKLYVAQYEGKIIAANLVVFYGKTATYLHGASDDAYKNVMAPYLLQWRQILDAASSGCEQYDFGGVKTEISDQGTVISKKGSWEGITKFKFGFSPDTKPIVYPGSYDIIINPWKYWAYRAIQKAKGLI